MNKNSKRIMRALMSILLLAACTESIRSQTLKWTENLGSNNSEANTITYDDSGNVYSAFNDVSGQTVLFYRTGEVQIVSHNQQGEINWDIQFSGTGHILDMVTNNGKIYALGVVKDSLQVGTEWIQTQGSQQYKSFILCLSSAGEVDWVSAVPWAENNLLVSLSIKDQALYTVGSFNDVASRLDAWDLTGSHLQSKIFEELRSLSDIEFDSMNNLYLGGTGTPDGMIDTVQYTNAEPASNYLIFLIKLSPDWQAEWIHLEPYFSFDFTPQVEVIDDAVYLAAIGNVTETDISDINVEIQKFDSTGASLLIQNTDYVNGIFKFKKMLHQDEETLLLATQDYLVNPVYIHLFNSDLLETRTDSISDLGVEAIHMAGGLEEYSIALSSYDSLWWNNEFVYDLTDPDFVRSTVTLCVYNEALGIHDQEAQDSYLLQLLPNPATDKVYVPGSEIGMRALQIFDAQGRVLSVPSRQQGNGSYLDIRHLKAGLYLILDMRSGSSATLVVE